MWYGFVSGRSCHHTTAILLRPGERSTGLPVRVAPAMAHRVTPTDNRNLKGVKSFVKINVLFQHALQDAAIVENISQQHTIRKLVIVFFWYQLACGIGLEVS